MGFTPHQFPTTNDQKPSLMWQGILLVKEVRYFWATKAGAEEAHDAKRQCSGFNLVHHDLEPIHRNMVYRGRHSWGGKPSCSRIKKFSQKKIKIKFLSIFTTLPFWGRLYGTQMNLYDLIFQTVKLLHKLCYTNLYIGAAGCTLMVGAAGNTNCTP